MPEMCLAYEKTYHITIFRNRFFQTVLTTLGDLHATLGGYHFSKPLEDDGRLDSVILKTPENDISHLFMSIIHLEAIF